MTDLPLHKISENDKTITLGWDPVPGVRGYVLSQAGHQVSNSFDPLKRVWVTDKVYPIKIEAFSTVASGIWPPPPQPEPLYQDGRASSFQSIDYSAGNTVPHGWGMIMVGDDIRLVDDPTGRFRKAWQVSLDKNSKNPWWVGQPADSASAEMTAAYPKRQIEIGQIDWFAQSLFLPDGPYLEWDNGWMIVTQLAYPTISSPPGSIICLGSNHWGNQTGVPALGFERHGGTVAAVGDQCPSSEIVACRPLTDIVDRWVDVVVGVEWQLSPTGWWVFSTRVEGETGFTTHVSKTGIPTVQKVISEPLPLRPVMDKQGGYQQRNPAWPDTWSQSYCLRGLTRHATREDAEAAL